MGGPRKTGPSRSPGIEVADVLRPVADEVFASPRYTAWHAKVLRDILSCRTSALGGHLFVCDHCGHEVPVYNSCRNRHCPRCQSLAQARWIEERRERILPTHYFHLVFTLPAELRPLAAKHPGPVYNLLIRAAADTIKDLARDPKRLGGTPAITTVLHTWTRELALHPHVHAIVSGGGLTDDGRWVPAREDYLFPVLVLGALFRGKFLDGLSHLVKRGEVVSPEEMDLGRTIRDLRKSRGFFVYVKQPFGGAAHVFEYLGRYTHRVAISSQRIRSLSPTAVTFLTKDGKTATLTPREFTRRFLLHVLPRGFTKIRHFGLLAPSAVKTRLPLAKSLLVAQQEAPPDTAAEKTAEALLEQILDDINLCPRCRTGHLRPSLPLPPEKVEMARAPAWNTS